MTMLNNLPPFIRNHVELLNQMCHQRWSNRRTIQKYNVDSHGEVFITAATRGFEVDGLVYHPGVVIGRIVGDSGVFPDLVEHILDELDNPNDIIDRGYGSTILHDNGVVGYRFAL
jgi:hypothetical protein